MNNSSIFVNPNENEIEDQLSVPAPAPANPDKKAELYDGEITAEGIHEQILAKDEDGYCPCSIIVHLEKYHNVSENSTAEDIKEDDKEYVDSVEIKRCYLDIFSLREDLISVNFVFDSSNDAYLQELNEVLHRYRLMSEEMSANPDNEPNTVPVLTISFMPFAMNGAGFASYQLPIDYCLALGEDGFSNIVHMLFDVRTILYSELEFSEEEIIEVEKNILQEDHSGLFEE